MVHHTSCSARHDRGRERPPQPHSRRFVRLRTSRRRLRGCPEVRDRLSVSPAIRSVSRTAAVGSAASASRSKLLYRCAEMLILRTSRPRHSRPRNRSPLEHPQVISRRQVNAIASSRQSRRKAVRPGEALDRPSRRAVSSGTASSTASTREIARPDGVGARVHSPGQAPPGFPPG